MANGLVASLLLSQRKFKNRPAPLRALATVEVVRNPQNRLRIGCIGVDLHIGAAAEQIKSPDRVLGQSEEFCIVTQSVRAGSLSM